jgi:hypothetical protein
MKIYISYSHHDKAFALKLEKALKEKGFETWIDVFDLHAGDNIFAKIQTGINECDFIITILSNHYVNSQWTLRELEAFEMRDVSNGTNTIIPILIEDCELPIFLRDKIYLDFRGSFKSSFYKLISDLNKISTTQTIKPSSIIFDQEHKESTTQFQVDAIREHFKKGMLSVFCGAGISIGAGIPPWSLLLRDLLTSLFNKGMNNEDSQKESEYKLAEFYQKYFNPSPLMIAQYLKNGLGNDFLKTIREALYKGNPNTSTIIDTIVELCRPQRSRESLHSIITFNFDDLIELNLRKNHIKYCSVFHEGQRPEKEELPIYHVHGFLPSAGDLSDDHNVVFSEDAYHPQFIEPFSWSNLIQLNHLNQNVCIFVGLSMTDPNLRRLLDVAMRKNPERKANHYVFKKRYNRKEIELEMVNIIGNKSTDSDKFIRITEMLEEQDSKKMGLNVIWIDDYDEIPKFFERIL